jgi:Uma2 family endonuclease
MVRATLEDDEVTTYDPGLHVHGGGHPMARQVIDRTTHTERRYRMPYEEYLAWAGENRFSEWVDGEVTDFVPPDTRHQQLASFLTTLLYQFVSLMNLGQVFAAPFEMRLREGRSSREPDLLFVASNHADRLDTKRLDGPADLVVEIISNESVTRDRRDKFAEYAASGVPEYWLIDPREGRQSIQVYTLTEEGYFEELHLDSAGVFRSTVLPGFWLDPAWLWQDPLPNPLTLLARIAPDAIERLVAGAQI